MAHYRLWTVSLVAEFALFRPRRIQQRLSRGSWYQPIHLLCIPFRGRAQCDHLRRDLHGTVSHQERERDGFWNSAVQLRLGFAIRYPICQRRTGVWWRFLELLVAVLLILHGNSFAGQRGSSQLHSSNQSELHIFWLHFADTDQELDV